MKKIFISALLMLLVVVCNAQSNKNNNMENKSNTLRLIYPQWQGGGSNGVSQFVPELPANDASKGYYLGAQLLNFLVPENKFPTVEVPVSLDDTDRKLQNGIASYQAIIKQSKAALDILEKQNPKRIITLGGDCAVSVVPFTFMAKKYPDDVAIVWMDAHPDINLPEDGYDGYHAMTLTACLGKGDKQIMRMLPAKFDTSKTLTVGVRDYFEGMEERQKAMGIKNISCEEVAEKSDLIMDWLANTGVSKVVIHFDLDVLDPKEIITAVGIVPNGLKTYQVARIINDISQKYDIVGLTIAEMMPRVPIQLRNMLNNIELFKQ